MDISNDASMTVQNISGGVTLGLSGRSGLNELAYKKSALSGYNIENDITSEDVEFQTITVIGSDKEDDPADILIIVSYVQSTAYPEVDLDLKFKDIPNGTSVEVDSSNSTYSISKQAISGSNLIGKVGMDQGELDITISLKLWVTNPSALVKDSNLSLMMSRIKGGSGPTEKILLGKCVLNLSDGQ
jgi:hypothetical protein